MDSYCVSYVYKLFLSVLFTIEIFFHSVSGEIRCEPLQLSYGIVCKCNSTYCDTIDPIQKLPEGEFVLYTSNKDGLRFSRTKGLFSNLSSQQSDITFKIDKSKKYQKFFGFGGAFTDSAGINILSLSKGAQDNLLRSYFSTDGIEYNFGRVPIGGCDFSTRPYTLDDGPQDDNLGKFSLAQEDYTYKIPLIKRAQAMSNLHINLVGTAWSAPPWMKTNHAITGLGVLKKEYYDLWAKYHIRFLESYKKEGLNFWGLTTGNEPVNGFVPFLIRFNSMGWLPKDHGRWIAENLGPMIRSSQFNQTKIISFDDQRLVLPIWAYEVMSNKKAAEYIDGIGIHWYWDFIIPVGVVVNLHNTYPDKFIINTESSQGDKPWETKVEPGSWDRGRIYVDDIIENLNNWLTGWIEWNLALDMSGGPNWAKNFVDAPILVDEKKDEFYKQPMFYALGHFSKFIKPDAVRIDVSPQTYKGTVRVLAVLNTDSSIVLVIHNGSRKKVSVTVVSDNENEAVLKLTPHSFNTLIYWLKFNKHH